MNEHTIDSWIQQRFLQWRPRGTVLGHAKNIRRTKRWFKRRGLTLEPQMQLLIPQEHRGMVSRRKRPYDAAKRIRAHFQVLMDLLRQVDPLDYPYDFLSVQISNAIHKQQSAGLIAALQELVKWDEAIDWRVRCWWQRPTSNSSKLIVWFRMVDIRELAFEEPINHDMKAYNHLFDNVPTTW